MPFIVLSPIWAAGKALYWGTPATQFVPWWVQAAESLAAGELPLWNPMLGMGTPLLANYQSALLYPGTWLYLLLYFVGGPSLMAWAMAPMLALHLAIAMGGMFFFLSRLGLGRFAQLVGGLALAFSGYFFTRSHFLSINAALAWLPWILAAAHELAHSKKSSSWLKLAALLCLQWLAGHAQMAWYSLLLLVFWSLYRVLGKTMNESRWEFARQLLRAGLLAAAISAAQLLPTLELLANSQRASQVDPELALNYSLWPWRLLTVLAPQLFGSPASGDFWGYGNFWEDAIYVGLIPLLLGLGWLVRSLLNGKGRRLAVFLAVLTTASILLALGSNTPLFPWLFANIPSFDMFQAPSRLSLWAVFSLALLAALGAQRWRAPAGRMLYWTRLSLAAATAVLLIGLLGPKVGANVDPTTLRALIPLGLAWLAFGALNLIAPRNENVASWSLWHWAAGTVVAAELVWLAWGFLPAVDASFYSEENESQILDLHTASEARIYMASALEYQLRFEDFFRFDRFESRRGLSEMRKYALPNLNVLDRIPSANNYDPIQIGRYADFLAILEGSAEADRKLVLQQLGVGTWLTLSDAAEVEIQQLESLPSLQWFGCAQLPAGPDEAQVLLASFLGEQNGVFIEGGSEIEGPLCEGAAEQSPADIIIRNKSSGLLTLDIKVDQAGWIFLADSYYPGWRALIDGEPAPIYPANLAFRAVSVPAEAQSIEFTYQPLSFWAGALISLLGIGLFAYQWHRHGKYEAPLD